MNEDQMSDADLWEVKVRAGMPKDQATAYVRNRQKRAAPAQPAEPDERIGAGRGALLSALQGATFGLADEYGAAVRSLPTLLPGGRKFGDAYRENVDAARTGLEQFREDHPVASIATELGGAVAGGLYVGTAAGIGNAGAATAGVGRSIAQGAAAGAVAGAGAAEGGVGNRARGAVTGGVFGGAVGAVAAPVARAAKGVVDLVRPAGAAAAAAETAASSAAGAATKKSSGGWKMLQQVSKLAGIDDADTRGQDMLLRAMERDGVKIDDLIARVESSRKPLTLADIAGENVRGLMRGTNTVVGEGRDAIPEMLTTRAKGQGQRILGDLEEGTGLTRDNVPQLANDLSATRSAKSRPLYERAYGTTDGDGERLHRTVSDPDVLATLEIPAFRKAYRTGMRIARVQGVEIPDYFNVLEEYGPDLAGKLAPPTVQSLDYMKRGLDDVIEAGMRRGSIGKTEARALRQRLNETLQKIDAAVPEYAQARGTFAGDSGPIEALELGKGFLTKMTPDEAVMHMQSMSDESREMFRRGAIDQIALALEGVSETSDATRKVLANSLQRKKMRLLFDTDEAFGAFEKAIDDEIQMARTKATVLGGSNTVNKLADVADMTDISGDDVVNLMTGNTLGFLRRAINSGMAQRARGLTENTANALSSRFTLQGSEDVGALLRELNRRAAEQAARAPRQGAVRRGTAATAGLMTGGQ